MSFSNMKKFQILYNCNSSKGLAGIDIPLDNNQTQTYFISTNKSFSELKDDLNSIMAYWTNKSILSKPISNYFLKNLCNAEIYFYTIIVLFVIFIISLLWNIVLICWRRYYNPIESSEEMSTITFKSYLPLASEINDTQPSTYLPYGSLKKKRKMKIRFNESHDYATIIKPKNSTGKLDSNLSVSLPLSLSLTLSLSRYVYMI